MRTYDRVNGVWREIDTDAAGNSDYVWLVTLTNVLKLNLGESPFYAQYGIPAQQSVVQQVFPDYYVTVTQQQFAQFFASLSITKVSTTVPIYKVRVTTNQGVQIPPFTFGPSLDFSNPANSQYLPLML